ncbi:MAG: adenylate kinase family protein [Candidatus Thermoplasmatota archaeon]
MRVALTGTPGCGKTTLAAEAAKHGWRVVDVKAWATAERCVVGFDAHDDAKVIDIEALATRLPADDGSKVLYEGHLSHLLPVDGVWVVRCDPAILRTRLKARGYSRAKVLENLEAEALDVILMEALDQDLPVVQRDGTRRTPSELYSSFAGVRFDGLKAPDLDPVDWSDQLPFV